VLGNGNESLGGRRRRRCLGHNDIVGIGISEAGTSEDAFISKISKIVQFQPEETIGDICKYSQGF
jgi:hypothetical protein